MYSTKILDRDNCNTIADVPMRKMYLRLQVQINQAIVHEKINETNLTL